MRLTKKKRLIDEVKQKNQNERYEINVPVNNPRSKLLINLK